MDQIIKDPWAGLRQLQCITFLGKGSGWRSLKVGVCQREQALQRTCGGHGEEGILPQHRQGPVSGTSLQGSLGGGPDRGGNQQGKQEAGRRPGHRKPHGISGQWGWVRSRCLWCLCGVMGEGQTETLLGGKAASGVHSTAGEHRGADDLKRVCVWLPMSPSSATWPAPCPEVHILSCSSSRSDG